MPVIIECPHCSTRFRLDADRLARMRAVLKCSRCQHVFPAPSRRREPRRPTPPPEEENLSLPFADEDEWSMDPPAPGDGTEKQLPLDAPGTPADAPQPNGATTGTPRDHVPLDDTTARDEPDSSDEDAEDFGEPHTISLRPVFLFLVLVVAAYALLYRTLSENPGWARQVTRNLPVIGTDIRDRTFHRDVALIGLKGRYERTREGKLVFLITGKAVNQSAAALRSVQVWARLLDNRDSLIAEQVTFCGSSFRIELIHELSVRQVAILRDLKPPQQFSIQPGEHCPFISIFNDVPTTAGSFTAEVVASQRHV